LIIAFPTPRYCHSTYYESKRQVLYVFGGIIDENPRLSDELWSLELPKSPSFVKLEGLKITHRCLSVCFMKGNKFYIYGGYGLNKISQRKMILNDFYIFDITQCEDTLREINAKGGSEMEGQLFKSVQLDNDQIAFMCSDLTKFWIFNTKSEIFTKILFKFTTPCPRSFFALNKLSDGRVILFGGVDLEDKTCFEDVFIMQSFEYYKQIHYSWSALDIAGPLGSFYNGHAMVVLPNDHLLIHGGCSSAFNPISKANTIVKMDISNRLKVIDIFNNYRWDEPISANSQKLHIYPRVQHIMNLITKEISFGDDYLFIHGGDKDGIVICDYVLFNLNTTEWEPSQEGVICPQLKCHASTTMRDQSKGELYVIFNGGVYIDHLNNCSSVTNKQKERCGCTTESISDEIYAYRNHSFSKILVTNKDLLGDRLRRLGHNLINYNGDIILLCGYAKYIGYMVDIIRFRVSENFKDKIFNLEGEDVVLKASEGLKGRMFGCVNILHNYITIFGGVRDDVALNDLWLINLNTYEAILIELNKDYIYPRFGMSSIVQHDKEESSSRLIIYGGSYWSGPQLISGVCNEIVVFNFKFNEGDTAYQDVDSVIPMVYGKGSKRIYHQSISYKGKMITFGGTNNLILQLNLINTRSCSYTKSLSAYLDESIYSY
jgi:hypothetical protein